MQVRHDEAIIVGSGIGGLVCALSLAPRSVTVITKTRHLQGGSSIWAQGGIAAAIGPGDTPAAHAEDTVAAGAGLSDARQALHLTEAGIAGMQWLLEQGVPFDRDAAGNLALGREAAHRVARIVHAGGDATGFVIMDALSERVSESPSIDVHDETFAYDLLPGDGRVAGVVTHSEAAGWVLHTAPVVVIATGGIGMAWWHTTNPEEATGDGLAMAARAGAQLADLEFVQFHPTALAVGRGGNGVSLPLLTEALRGAGALLVDAEGRRFMQDVHPAAELAPRDVVARAIHERSRAGRAVYLDLRPVLAGPQRDAFPTAVKFAREAGLDPFTRPLPVTPAAHYHMGGVVIDERGRTSLPGLRACGEVATTGVHGANRLASNSLLEALVFARDVAADIGESATTQPVAVPAQPPIAGPEAAADIERLVAAARDIMSRDAGIVRDGAALEAAVARLGELARELDGMQQSDSASVPHAAVRRFGEARNLLLISRLVTMAAEQRRESRGAHFRRDYPNPDPEWQYSQSLDVERLDRATASTG